ncbi:Homeobox protein Nkx-3.1 [Aphelenchoides avenae]|nr:Homeobox protein Nkx-3.1 [Aphelenchus avenae]
MSTEDGNKAKCISFSVEQLLSSKRDSTGSHLTDSTRKCEKTRKRSTFSALQMHFLESEFYKHRYVSPERRAGLAALLGLTQQQVKIWFQNRRYKSKPKNADSGGSARPSAAASQEGCKRPATQVPLPPAFHVPPITAACSSSSVILGTTSTTRPTSLNRPYHPYETYQPSDKQPCQYSDVESPRDPYHRRN